MNTLSQTFHLVIRRKKRGLYSPLSARITENAPELAAGEVALELKLEVPELLFKRPVLSAKVVIPESAVKGPEIKSEVANTIEAALRSAVPPEIRISVGVEDD